MTTALSYHCNTSSRVTWSPWYIIYIYSIARLILFILIIIVYNAYGVCRRTVMRISFLKYFLSSNESENIRQKNAFNEVYAYIIQPVLELPPTFTLALTIFYLVCEYLDWSPFNCSYGCNSCIHIIWKDISLYATSAASSSVRVF